MAAWLYPVKCLYANKFVGILPKIAENILFLSPTTVSIPVVSA